MKNDKCCNNDRTYDEDNWNQESNRTFYNKNKSVFNDSTRNNQSNYYSRNGAYNYGNNRYPNRHENRDRKFERDSGYLRSSSFASQGRSNSVTSVPRFTGRRSNSKCSVNAVNGDSDSMPPQPQINSRCEEFGRFLRERGRNEHSTNYRNNYSNRDWNKMLPPNPELEKRLFSQASAGINFDEYEKIPVSCSGNNPPVPLVDFVECDLHKIVANNVNLANYDRPTPVQKYAIPTILERRDMMACAQTGSGKTAAFLLPLISLMLNDPAPINKSKWKSPMCLILTPTRELCIQIFQEAKKFAYRSQMKIVVVYGGAPISAQIREVEQGVDLLVATPGRLIDLLERGYISLQHLRYLVLDEADRMLDMGFEPQIRRIVDDFGMPLVGERQTLMFSATFPKAIQELAAAFLQDYVFLCVGRVGSTSENIIQQIMWVPEDEKARLLVDILNSLDESILVLIFVETRKGADTLRHFLLNHNYQVACIHGDRNQRERELALRTFKNGETPILVATAVAARGLDVPNVRHVINYDMPNGIDEYVHRIGRTGRVGNVGEATSFFNENNASMAYDLINLLEECHQEIPDFLKSVSESTISRSKYGIKRGGNRRMNSYQSFDCRLSSRTRFNVNQRGAENYDASPQSLLGDSHGRPSQRQDWWSDDSPEVSQTV